MTLGELIAELEQAGLIKITGRPSTDGKGLELNDWLDTRGIDPETPIPVWNPDAEAWEV